MTMSTNPSQALSQSAGSASSGCAARAPRARPRSALLAGVGLTLALAGCGSDFDVGSGHHTALRISKQGNPTTSGTCDSTDATTADFGDPDTWFVYGVASNGGNVPYLDTGSDVYKGGLVNDEYSFRGVETNPEDKGNRTETTRTTTVISLRPSGDEVTGTLVKTVETSCTGSCNGFEAGRCSRTTSLVGVVIGSAADAP
jgi:hypothetical protein